MLSHQSLQVRTKITEQALRSSSWTYKFLILSPVVSTKLYRIAEFLYILLLLKVLFIFLQALQLCCLSLQAHCVFYGLQTLIPDPLNAISQGLAHLVTLLTFNLWSPMLFRTLCIFLNLKCYLLYYQDIPLHYALSKCEQLRENRNSSGITN